MNDFSNDNSNEKDIVSKTEIEDLPTAETQDDQFVRNLFLYPTVQEAARQAGITGSMLKSGVYNKLKTKRMQDKIKEFAIAHNVASLPRIMRIEDKVLDHLEKKPLDSSKHVRMLAEKKRIAGILGDDTPKPQPTQINIEEFRINYWKEHGAKTIEEAEVIEDKTSTK